MTRHDQRDETALQDCIIAMDKEVTLIFDATGEVLPLWHVVTASGDHRVIVPPPGIDKETMCLLVRAYFALHDIVSYVFVDEAWQLEIKDSEIREVMQHGIREHPDRTEVVLYTAEDETRQLTARRVITRPAMGKATLGPLEIDTMILSEGRFVGMLPQRGTRH